jgi:trehalose 6-phosphate synthase
LVVVSNRVTSPRQARSGAQGGLAVAVQAALEDWGGVWFGWSGELRDDGGEEANVFHSGQVTYATVDLSSQDYEEYYNGFANCTLWPLFHYRLDLTEFSRRTLSGYQRVNQLFAERLRPLLRDDDLIWVHDYHLIPLAEQLRHAGCRQRMGFFLHIPWPALEVFLALPNHREIVHALCAYDLVGFQTDNDVRGFVNYIKLEAGGEVDPDGTVKAFGRRLRVGAFPISIDTARLAGFAREAEFARQTVRLRDSLRGRKLMIGVDRLDYSKGLPQRFRAYEQLLEHYPENRGRVVFLQIAPPSRQDVPEYLQIRRQLEATAGHVNGAYAEFDWMPLRYLNTGFSRRILAGFLRIATVGVVTPLRDGMNLVAKEYVAAQNPKDPGVLLLSRFAGASAELDGAVPVNPYDVEGTAGAMQAALSMPLEERRERWESMYRRLETHDVDYWRGAFLDALSAMEPAACE